MDLEAEEFLEALASAQARSAVDSFAVVRSLVYQLMAEKARSEALPTEVRQLTQELALARASAATAETEACAKSEVLGQRLEQERIRYQADLFELVYQHDRRLLELRDELREARLRHNRGGPWRRRQRAI